MTDHYQLHTDGGARGNPGPAGIGVVLRSSDGEVVDEIAQGIGWATNNVAEYMGLIEGLKLAIKHDVEILDVFMDSVLVIEQMKGKFKVKHPGLKPLHKDATEIAKQFKKATFRAIPREQNAHADRLMNEGVDQWLEINPDFPPPLKTETLF